MAYSYDYNFLFSLLADKYFELCIIAQIPPHFLFAVSLISDDTVLCCQTTFYKMRLIVVIYIK